MERSSKLQKFSTPFVLTLPSAYFTAWSMKSCRNTSFRPLYPLCASVNTSVYLCLSSSLHNSYSERVSSQRSVLVPLRRFHRTYIEMPHQCPHKRRTAQLHHAAESMPLCPRVPCPLSGKVAIGLAPELWVHRSLFPAFALPGAASLLPLPR